MRDEPANFLAMRLVAGGCADQLQCGAPDGLGPGLAIGRMQQPFDQVGDMTARFLKEMHVGAKDGMRQAGFRNHDAPVGHGALDDAVPFKKTVIIAVDVQRDA